MDIGYASTESTSRLTSAATATGAASCATSTNSVLTTYLELSFVSLKNFCTIGTRTTREVTTSTAASRTTTTTTSNYFKLNSGSALRNCPKIAATSIFRRPPASVVEITLRYKTSRDASYLSRSH